MTTNTTLEIDKKGKFHTGFPSVNWERFSCAGECCTENETCARWNGISKEKNSPPQELKAN